MRLGIDIDGVLTDFDSYWREDGAKWQYLNGHDVVYKQSYNLNYSYGFTDETGKILHNDSDRFKHEMFFKYARECRARANAAEVMGRLRNMGHELYIITKRHLTYVEAGYDIHEARQEVLDWLFYNNIYYDYIEFAEPCGEKREECERLKIDYLFDDCPYVVNDLKGTNIKCVVMSTFYNMNFEADYRVYSWFEFLALIEKLSKGDE